MAFQTVAYTCARILRRDYRSEIDRLEQQSRARSYLETLVTFGVLFGLAVVAASYGWIGMLVYFLAVLVLF